VLEQVFRSVGAGALASPRNGGLITSNPDGAPRGGALGSIEQLELLVCEKLYIVIEEIWSDDLEALIRRYVATVAPNEAARAMGLHASFNRLAGKLPWLGTASTQLDCSGPRCIHRLRGPRITA
jgi:hypothetical protein